MALPLTDRDKFLLLAALGLPESANRVIALLELAGTGNMTGPGSASDNAIVRFDGTTGALVQNSSVLVSDSGAISGIASLNAVSAATLAFLDATSSIQTQLNSKLTSGGTLLAAAGSVGAPSHSFTADTNTGIFNPGADELAITAGGVQQTSFAGGQEFSVGGTSAAAPHYSFNGSPTVGMALVGANRLVLSTAGVAKLDINVSNVLIGASGDTTAIHAIRGALQTPAAGVLTLTNGPGAATGNPAVYLTLNINGTNYAIPAWAF